MPRYSAQGMREHLRERENMDPDGPKRLSGMDDQECPRDHERISAEFRFCPECGEEVREDG